jgi:hypothetical protein
VALSLVKWVLQVVQLHFLVGRFRQHSEPSLPLRAWGILSTKGTASAVP